MGEAKRYAGGCHCGKVRYEVSMELGKVLSCNCSICSKKAGLLSFVSPAQMDIKSGQPSELTDYQFNKHNIHHLFCPVCGIASYSTGIGPGGQPMFAINVRCLDDVDTSALEVQHFDGRSA